jgi:hypothetical protein
VWAEFVGLWDACRAGMGGVASWPEAGGVNDQPAWVVEAFGVLSAALAAEEKRDKEGRS